MQTFVRETLFWIKKVRFCSKFNQVFILKKFNFGIFWFGFLIFGFCFLFAEDNLQHLHDIQDVLQRLREETILKTGQNSRNISQRMSSSCPSLSQRAALREGVSDCYDQDEESDPDLITSTNSSPAHYPLTAHSQNSQAIDRRRSWADLEDARNNHRKNSVQNHLQAQNMVIISPLLFLPVPCQTWTWIYILLILSNFYLFFFWFNNVQIEQRWLDNDLYSRKTRFFRILWLGTNWLSSSCKLKIQKWKFVLQQRHSISLGSLNSDMGGNEDTEIGTRANRSQTSTQSLNEADFVQVKIEKSKLLFSLFIQFFFVWNSHWKNC